MLISNVQTYHITFQKFRFRKIILFGVPYMRSTSKTLNP